MPNAFGSPKKRRMKKEKITIKTALMLHSVEMTITEKILTIAFD